MPSWSGDEWTSTPAGQDQFFIRNGPFHDVPPDDHDKYHKKWHRHSYHLLEAPSFRIVKC